jgi:GNAT superfamily N-acetyltransferase
MAAEFRVEVLGVNHSPHARNSFSRGLSALGIYFARQASQDIRRRASACDVAVQISSNRLAGYYTLAAAGVPLTDLPQTLAKRLPRYPSVPVARLGRLAVDTAFHGQKLGAALLADAAVRVARSEVAVFALVVDAKDEAAEAFYLHHGVERFGAHGKRLIVALRGFGENGA